MTLRYLPSRLVGRVGKSSNRWADQAVVLVTIHAPRDPKRGADGYLTAIRPDLFDVAVTLESGAVRHFGTERVYPEGCRWVLEVNDADEVLAKWDRVLPDYEDLGDEGPESDCTPDGYPHFDRLGDEEDGNR